ncbi:MAG: DUF6142 family protein [Lachnospiraceae bacterium]|uniref:DUF6142 family protein n=1 Tax=Falcatimonas sp. MSJ-15 TaxID=2841515 RepID=UPI001C10E7F4|nr:DUF6142 family protein [Falcatimonas sp. MSJ-15]MBQ5733998.1 hypothetical protein [Lachnospiraceae bacterium]MBU5470723.1 hypothetical protein [Falcatimonas sp. MSJ-15]MEE0958470.1 DUF6142 family protein [Lachnospiraceae bacterium]
MAKDLKFVGKKNATGGILSTIIGIISLVLFGLAIYISFEAKGKGGKMVGIIGFIVVIMTIIGTTFGIKGFKEKEKYYLYSVIGTLLCGILLFIMISIIAVTFI